jgi:hypothetical protein
MRASEGRMGLLSLVLACNATHTVSTKEEGTIWQRWG